jgi:hypothetical protein
VSLIVLVSRPFIHVFLSTDLEHFFCWLTMATSDRISNLLSGAADLEGNNSEGGRGSSDDESDDNSATDNQKRKRTSQSMDKNLKEKNKEHARNTRLRKKNFIDHLKQAIHDLGRERDDDEMRLRSELTRIATEVLRCLHSMSHQIRLRWR